MNRYATAIISLLISGLATGTLPTRIPADSRGNRLIVTAENVSSWSDIDSLDVCLTHVPRCVRFESLRTVLRLIPRRSQSEIELVFNVDREAPLRRPDTVEIRMSSAGTLLWTGAFVWEFTGPAEFRLDRNFPNPFNPATTIRFAIPVHAHVTAVVFDMLGREVRRLLDEPREAGYGSLVWDGTTAGGAPAASGVYYCRFSAAPAGGGEGFRRTLKMLLLR